MQKGKGWFGQRRRHSQASKLGWKRRRDKFNSYYPTDRSRYQLKMKARAKVSQRSKWALHLDRKRTARIRLDPDIPYQANQYIKDPSGKDLIDYDTKQQSIYSPEKPKDTTNDELVESKPKKGKRGARPLSNYDKKAIDYIQQTTNSKFTQARGMYFRIKRKNIDYQTVDWDSKNMGFKTDNR